MTLAAEICVNGASGPSCEDEHREGSTSADKLFLVLQGLLTIKPEREPHTNERSAGPMNEKEKFANWTTRRQTGLKKNNPTPTRH